MEKWENERIARKEKASSRGREKRLKKLAKDKSKVASRLYLKTRKKVLRCTKTTSTHQSN